MLTVVIVPEADFDASKLLRNKVTYEAETWYWKNKKKTQLAHRQYGHGYIEVDDAQGILVAEIRAHSEDDTFLLAEKLIGACVRWFQQELSGITIQFRREMGRHDRRRGRRRRA